MTLPAIASLVLLFGAGLSAAWPSWRGQRLAALVSQVVALGLFGTAMSLNPLGAFFGALVLLTQLSYAWRSGPDADLARSGRLQASHGLCSAGALFLVTATGAPAALLGLALILFAVVLARRAFFASCVALACFGLLHVGATGPTLAWALLITGCALALGGARVCALRPRLLCLGRGLRLLNLGLTLVGLGLFRLALSRGDAELASLALAGALLHLLNHSFDQAFRLERPKLGHSPLVFTAALLGGMNLPPLGGLASLCLIFLALLRVGVTALPAALVLGVALAWSLTSLADLLARPGEPQTETPPEPDPLSKVLALGSLALGLFPSAALLLIAGPVRQLTMTTETFDPAALSRLLAPLDGVAKVSAALLGGIVLLAFVRSVVLPAPRTSQRPLSPLFGPATLARAVTLALAASLATGVVPLSFEGDAFAILGLLALARVCARIGGEAPAGQAFPRTSRHLERFLAALLVARLWLPLALGLAAAAAITWIAGFSAPVLKLEPEA